MARLGCGAGLDLREDHATFADFAVKALVFLRVDHVDTAGDHGDRARLQGSGMGTGIDAAGQSRDHHEASLSQVGGKPFGETPSVQRGVAGADHGDGGPRQQMTLAHDADQRRRVLNVNQIRRIARLDLGNENGADRLLSFHLALRRRQRADRHGLAPSAAARQIGQGLERRRRRTEAFDQPVKSDGSDVLATDEPQPVQPLGGGKGSGRSVHGGRDWGMGPYPVKAQQMPGSGSR